jgi:hypothetical protein
MPYKRVIYNKYTCIIWKILYTHVYNVQLKHFSSGNFTNQEHVLSVKESSYFCRLVKIKQIII